MGRDISRSGGRSVGLGIALILLVVVAYIPAIQAGYIWDDDDYVTENGTLRDAAGLRRIWLEVGAVPQYYPLVHTTFWLEHQLWGLRPLGYHVTNIALHVLSAILLFVLLRRLEVPGAWLAAGIFALHPVHVESVAWITERKNVLSGVFYLSALLAYVRFAGIGLSGSAGAMDIDNGVPRRGAGRWWFYALSSLLLICALLSKTVTCTLPVAALLLIWWKRDRIRWRDLAAAAPLLALGAAGGLLTAWVEKHKVGATGAEWALSLVDRCLIAGRAVWFYAGKIVLPSDLTFIYPRWRIDSGLWWQYAYPLAVIGVIVVLWLMRRRLGKGPLVGVLFFVITLGPALGFVNVYPMRYSFVADHFQYLASIGLIVLLAGAGVSVWRRFEGWAACTRWTTGLGVAGVAMLAAGLVLHTSEQARAYQDEKALWTSVLAGNPGCWMAHTNLGSILESEGKVTEAIAHYGKALQFNRDAYPIHNNLGSALSKRGCLEEAIEHYGRAIRLEPRDPRPHRNQAIALARNGQIDEAIDRFGEAVRLDASCPESQVEMADLLASKGRVDEAADHYNKALALRPGWLTPLNNLAWLLATRPDVSFSEANQAVRLAEEACRSTHDSHPGCLDTLAAAHAAAGSYDKAVAAARKATELALASGQEQLAVKIRGRLTLYEGGRPYQQRQTSRDVKRLLGLGPRPQSLRSNATIQ
ncbi:MAG: tetratricopeptide repeat protein [Phycisphaerae bacterium]|nr:tetratricopeptide repeat protein [Phycisphaerae bacterium]